MASLDTNLVVNPGFENVNLNMTGDYNGPQILDWTGTAFAYSHDGSSSSSGVVPDYADGADPPGAGHWYFSSNNADPALDIHDAGLFFQDIDVSTGATASAIAGGSATWNLSAYMSSYLNDTDVGHVRADFLASGGGNLGSAVVNDADPGPDTVWSLNSGSGAVPIGTATVRLSLYGTRTAGGTGADGFIDNVDFRVLPEPSAFGVGCVLLAALGFVRRRHNRP